MDLWALDYAFKSQIKLKSSKCCKRQEDKL